MIDAVDIVILAVLPDQMAALRSSPSFGEEQVVVSLAAGWPPSLLAEHVDPAATVCQMIPLPMIALHTGPVVFTGSSISCELCVESFRISDQNVIDSYVKISLRGVAQKFKFKGSNRTGVLPRSLRRMSDDSKSQTGFLGNDCLDCKLAPFW